MSYQPDHHISPKVDNLSWKWVPAFHLKRILDGLPGIIVLLTLIFSLLGVLIFPKVLLTITALLAVYTAIRFVNATFANLRGLHLIHVTKQIQDWHKLYEDQQKKNGIHWNDIHHIVIIPNYCEPIEILQKSLNNLTKSSEAHSITIVLAMEAIEPQAAHKAEQLKKQYQQYFENIYITIHPGGLPDEIQCKSANLAWAGRWIKRKLVDQMGYNLDHLIVTTMDADTLWHEQYFSALTYFFLTDSEPHYRFWQAPIRYHSNFYDIHPLLRQANVYSTAMELAYLTSGISLPISSYSLSLRLLDSGGYWDQAVISDEWHTFIKLFFAQNGNVRLIPIFLPFLASSVTGETLRDACINRYRQTLRHSWGSKEIGYTLYQILHTQHINSSNSRKLFMSVAHDMLIGGAGWVLATVGSQGVLLIHPELREAFLANPFSSPALVITNISFGLMAILAMLFLIIDLRVRPQQETPINASERFLVFLGFLVLPLFPFLFLIFPLLHAQIMLLFGKPLEFQVTSKI